MDLICLYCDEPFEPRYLDDCEHHCLWCCDCCEYEDQDARDEQLKAEAEEMER